MSKGGSKPPKPGAAEKAQSQYLTGQQALFAPWQAQQVAAQQGLLGSALDPAMDAFRTDISAPERQTIERQYGQARQNILNTSGARGGLQQRMLGGLDMARADTVANAINNAKQLGIQRALGYASGQNPLGATAALSGGLGNLSSLEQNRTQLGAQSQGGKGGGIGSLIGGIGGSFFGPMGTMLGSSLGGMLGNAVGGGGTSGGSAFGGGNQGFSILR